MILGTQTITRLRGTPVEDPYSGEQSSLSWDTPDRLDIAGCSVQPASAQPVLRDLREGVIVDLVVWAPREADVTELDRVEYAGRVYLVSDTIQRWDIPVLGHVVIPLRRVEG